MTILAPVDASLHARSALELAARLAGPLRARVVTLHAVEEPAAPHAEATAPEGGPFLEAARIRPRADGSPRLAQRVRRTLAGAPSETVIRTADAARAIRDEVARQTIDLLVIGAHGQSVESSLVLGEVVDSLIAAPPCPIICVSDGARSDDASDRETEFVATDVVVPREPSSAALLGEGFGRLVAEALGVPSRVRRFALAPGAAPGPFPWLLVNGARSPRRSARARTATASTPSSPMRAER